MYAAIVRLEGAKVAKRNFTIKMTGKARPETVSAGDLADFIEHVEKALVAYAKTEALELRNDVAVSLVGISEGSNELTFAAQVEVIPGVVAMAAAITNRDFSKLPYETHQNLHSMVELGRKHHWGLELYGAGTAAAVIEPGEEIPSPSSPVMVSGSTNILARCLRVGGVTPKAEIRVLKGDKILHVVIDEDMAKELAKRLYDVVVLEGQATWNAETWEIRDFSVSGVQPYRKIPISSAFSELQETTSGSWEGVDAVAYVGKLRGATDR